MKSRDPHHSKPSPTSLLRRRRHLAAGGAVLFLVLLFFLSTTSSLLPRFPFSALSPTCDLFSGEWIQQSPPLPSLYDESCPFHRHAWNCRLNGHPHLAAIASWSWVPAGCGGAPIPRIDPFSFLEHIRGRRIGLVGDSLNENFVVALLCTLRAADPGARKWKRRGAWRGGYFPKFDVTVAYHRAVLLARYGWQPKEKDGNLRKDAVKGIYRVDVDVPADDWVNATKFYDVLVFNTGHWWGTDKFPKETPLVFYKEGKPIVPALGIIDGLKVVLHSMVSYIEREVPKQTLKFWRTQSPRHFYGGEWDHNGSCLFDAPLNANELDSWFHPRNNRVNKEARVVNSLIQEAIHKTGIQMLNLTHLSEFRADAHPAIWLGKKDAVAIWGQDCMHWCLPGVPDTWVDILASKIKYGLEAG